MLLLKEVSLFLIKLIATNLIGSRVAIDGWLKISGFFVAISKPTMWEGFFIILVYRFLEVLFCLFELFKPEQSGSHIVVVNRIFRLQTDGFFVVLDGCIEVL